MFSQDLYHVSNIINEDLSNMLKYADTNASILTQKDGCHHLYETKGFKDFIA